MSGVMRVCARQQCARCWHRVDRRPCECVDCDVKADIGNCLRGNVQARPGTVDSQRAANEVTRTEMMTTAGGYGELPHLFQCRPGSRFGPGGGPAGEELDLTELQVVVRQNVGHIGGLEGLEIVEMDTDPGESGCRGGLAPLSERESGLLAESGSGEGDLAGRDFWGAHRFVLRRLGWTSAFADRNVRMTCL